MLSNPLPSPDVEEQLLVHEAAVQLPAHVIGRVVREVVIGVEGLKGVGGDRERRPTGQHARNPDRERRVAATGGRRSGHGEAQAVIGVDEVRQLADELDRLLVREPPLLAVGNERVSLVPVGICLTGVLDVELPLVRVAGEARLDAREEPELVLDDVAAERRSEIADVVEVARAGDDGTCGGHRLGATLQGSGSERPPDAPVELVAARLGHAADRAARRAAVLGHVAAGDDVDLVEELDGERTSENSVGGVVHREPIDQVRALGRGRAVDRDAIEVHRGLRCRRGDRVERANGTADASGAAQREVLDEVLVDGGAHRARAHVDDRCSAGDDDGSALDRLREDLDVESKSPVRGHVEAGARVRVVGLLLEPEGVRARRELGDPVETAGIGHHDLLTLETGRGGRHHDVGDRSMGLCVDDVSRQHRGGALRPHHRGKQPCREHERSEPSRANQSHEHPSSVERRGIAERASSLPWSD
jgi:hypothetical protein